MFFMPQNRAFVVAAPDGCDCWKQRVNRFAEVWLLHRPSELVFKRGRNVAVRCAVRRCVMRGAREVTVVELTCTREGTPAVLGCFPLCKRMLEAIAGRELKLGEAKFA